MKHLRQITFEFVDTVPSPREEGKLYISTKYRTAIHSCFCGCGMKVVTPLRPARWRLTYDGDTVTLAPSIGNWSFKCRSHYIIRGNQAIPAGSMTKRQIVAGRRHDRAIKDAYFQGSDVSAPPSATADATPAKKRGLVGRLFGRRRRNSA
jgi:hypothetical protein